jgi:hypothetical protein
MLMCVCLHENKVLVSCICVYMHGNKTCIQVCTHESEVFARRVFLYACMKTRNEIIAFAQQVFMCACIRKKEQKNSPSVYSCVCMYAKHVAHNVYSSLHVSNRSVIMNFVK